MRTNVFLRSTRRQWVRAVVMLVVIAAVTFAFTARGAEYLLVRQETERLGSYYTSIGSLAPAGGEKWADWDEAAAYLAARPEVETVNRYRNVSAVAEKVCNADIELPLVGTTGNVAFYGTLSLKTPNYYYFIADTPLAGYPEHIEKGRMLILMRGENEQSQDAYDALQEGERFLAAGYFDTRDPSCVSTEDGVFLKLKPVTEDAFFYPVAEGAEADFTDPVLAQWKDLILYSSELQHTLNALAVENMSALPDVQEEGQRIYLTDGRFLDAADTREGRRVCVINNGFASLRGLEVGDALTLTLKDMPSYFGYCLSPEGREESLALWREGPEHSTEPAAFEIVGIYEYTDGDRFPCATVRNNLYIPSSVVPEDFTHANGSGIDQKYYNMMSYWGYSLDKRGYQSVEGPYPGAAAFLLKDPALESAFLKDTRADLEAMGFRADMVPSGWENFQAAAGPMERSSLYNAAIFTAVLAVTLVLVAFAYFHMRRKELAIVRAMGVPAGRCAAEISLPLLIVGFAGVVPGAFLGWRYAKENAAETLGSLAAFGGEGAAMLPVGYLAALCGGTAALLAVVTLVFAHVRARTPLLRQIQGGAPAGAKKASGKTDPVPVAAVSAPATASGISGVIARETAPVSAGHGGGTRLVLRFVWRHIVRSRAKSLLTVLLAASFTVGLAAISLSIENSSLEIEALYQTISVSVGLVKADSTSTTVKGGGFLFEETIQSVLDTGYVLDAYLEGANNGRLYTYDNVYENGNSLSIRGYGAECDILGVDDLDGFLSEAGTGSSWTIAFDEGWDADCFGEDWRESGQTLDEETMLPVLVSRQLYDAYMTKDGRPLMLTCKGKHKMCKIIGAYDGAAGETDVAVTPLVLMPRSALQALVGDKMRYSAASFTVDPAMNRDLDAFREAIDTLANTPRIGAVPVRVVLRDGELRQAAEPLEKSVELMRILYPVMLVLAVLVAAAVSALFVMLSAKEGAILRIQGTGKRRVQVMLSLQQLFPSLGGLVIGLAGVRIYLSGRPPELMGAALGGAALCAVLYLAAAAVGAAGASMSVTGKNPLEMLQVKE